ncbi:MAG: choice-of-anchor Q domain-containing protein, partial [Phycisphaerae bacterium]
MASRALNRLRELYHGVLLRSRMANARRDGYPSHLHEQSSCALMEALEPRLLLSGSYSLWGGFTDYRGEPDAHQRYFDIDQQDYALLAESSEEHSTLTGNGAYDFYVLAAAGTVEVDAFTASNGDYPPVTWSSNVQDPAAMHGPPDGVFGLMGGQSATGTYGSVVVMENPGTWDGLSVDVGEVTEVIFSIAINENYEGFAEPCRIEMWAGAETNPYSDLELTSVTLRTPSGEVYDLQQESAWQWEFDSGLAIPTRQEADALFPADTYTFTYSGPWGSQTVDIFLGDEGQPLAWPTEKPQPLGPSMGETEVGSDVTLTWQASDDPNVGHIWTYVNAVSPEGDYSRIFSDAFAPSQTTAELTGLAAGTWHEWGMSLSNRQTAISDNGHFYAVTKATENSSVFRTAGGETGEPDLFFDVLNWTPGPYYPGDEMNFEVRGGNQGDGIALATDGAGNLEPITMEVRLSTDTTWGNEDDVLVYAPRGGYWMPGDVFENPAAALPVPEETPPGAYYAAVRIDAGEAIAENNETNNTWWSPTADFVVESLWGTEYVVNSLADVVAADGVVTLREAIEAANTNTAVTADVLAGSDTRTDRITFDASLAGGTIVLDGEELYITDDLEIVGPGQDQLTIDADGRSSVFYVEGRQAAVSLSGLTITGGNSADWGGGIHNFYGTVTLSNVTVSANSATGEHSSGGGIYNFFGTMTLSNVTVSGNSAADGGGIYNHGTMTLSNVTVSGNSATGNYSSGGGIYNNYGGTLTLNNSIVALNEGSRGADLRGSFTGSHNLIGIDPGFVRNPSAGADGVWGTDDDDFGDLRLLETSIAINAGDNVLAVDAQGEPLTVDLDGAARVMDGVVDVGAYEYQGAPGFLRESASSVVTTLSDLADSTDGEVSLREAVVYANWTGSPVTFASELAGGTIV